MQYGKNRLKSTFFFAALLSLISCLVTANSALNNIQQQIKQQESKISSQKREQQQLQSTLKNQEMKINGVMGELRQTEMSLQDIRKKINEIDKQIQHLTAQEKEQKKRLAKQIDAMYRANLDTSALEKMLSSKEIQNLDRMSVYYKQLGQVRVKLIQDLKQTQEQLKQERAAIANQQKEQKDQLSLQKKQHKELKQLQQERQVTLDQLNAHLAQNENKLASLKANEIALQKEISRAEQNARQQESQEKAAFTKKKQAEESKTQKPYQPTSQEQKLLSSNNGLGEPRKQFSAPVSGRILQPFGAYLGGDVRSKGVVIAATKGSPVKAIASGRVMLANRLNGYGYVVILKHGENDLSLYGYNQAVTVQEGQLVSAGQKIAEAGNSGMESRPAVYFEIRRKGVTVNPMSWIK